MNLNPDDVQKAVADRREFPKRLFGKTIPIPNFDKPFHVGAIVKGKSEPARNRYFIHGFVDEFAIIIPINPNCSPSVAAYPHPIDDLTPATLSEEYLEALGKDQ